MTNRKTIIRVRWEALAIVALIVLFPLASLAAAESVHNQGKAIIRYLPTQAGPTVVREVEFSLNWVVYGFKAGTMVKDPSVVGRIMGDFEGTFNPALSYQVMGDVVYIEGKAYKPSDYGFDIQKIVPSGIEYSFTVYFGALSRGRISFQDYLSATKRSTQYTGGNFLQQHLNIAQEEVLKGLNQGVSFSDLQVRITSWAGFDDFVRLVKDVEKKAMKGRTLLADAGNALQEKNWSNAIGTAQRAIQADPSTKAEADRIIAQAQAGAAADSAARQAEAKSKQAAAEEEEKRAAAKAMAAREGGGKANAATGSQNSTQTASSRASTPASTYSAPPPSASSASSSQYLEEQLRKVNDDAATRMRMMDEASSMLSRQIDMDMKWRQASTLNLSGLSPESMIAQVKQKKQELESLASERRKEFNRQMEKLTAELAAQAAQSSSDSGTAAAIGILSAAGTMAGNYSIEKAKRDEQRRLDEELTREFGKMQKEFLGKTQEAKDEAQIAAAGSVFPEEERYLRAVYDYYSAYSRRLQNDFSIQDTNWLYPSGSLPSKPSLGSQPSFTTDSLRVFIAGKEKIASSGGRDSAEARQSMVFLSNYAIKQFPSAAFGYYYKGWLSSDVIEKTIMNRKALSIAPGETSYQVADRANIDNLSKAFFTAMGKADVDFIRRSWETGLPSTFKTSDGKSPYTYGLEVKDQRSLDKVLALTKPEGRALVAQGLLGIAAAKNFTYAIDTLVRYGASCDRAVDAKGNTPLLVAASQGAQETISALVERYKQNPNDALEIAQSGGDKAACYWIGRYLLNNGFVYDSPQAFGKALIYEPNLMYSPYNANDSFLTASVRLKKQQVLATFISAKATIDASDKAGSPLIVIAREVDAPDPLFKMLLDAGADPDAASKDGRTLLHWAIGKKRMAVFSEALPKMASLNARDREGNAALHLAIASGQKALVSVLLEHKANLLLADIHGKTPLHVAATIPDAPIDVLLKAGANTDMTDDQGNTPLHTALLARQEKAVACLLAAQPDLVIQNKLGQTALTLAVAMKSPQVLPILEASPARDLQDIDGKTPIHLALETGQDEVVGALILAGSRIDIQDKSGNTALHTALKISNSNYPSFLGLDVPWNSQNEDGDTPYRLLVEKGSEEEALAALETGLVNVGISNNVGTTYLHEAARRSFVPLARALVERKAPLAVVEGQDKMSPLHVAATFGNPDMVMVLLEAGANKNAKTLAKKKPADLAWATNDRPLAKLIEGFGQDPNPFRRAFSTVVRFDIDARENSGLIGRSKKLDWGIELSRTESNPDSSFIGIAIPLFSGPGSYGNFWGLDLRLLYAGDTGTYSQDKTRTTRLTGVALSPGVVRARELRGATFTLTHVDVETVSGLSFAPWNRVGTVNGVQLGIFNQADTVHGAQIGIVNVTKVLRGFQLGLIAYSGDRNFYLVNWGF